MHAAMRWLGTKLCCAVLLWSCWGAHPASSESTEMKNPLEQYQWEHRLFVLTVAEEDREAAEAAIGKHREALRERHVLVLPVGWQLAAKAGDRGDRGRAEWVRQPGAEAEKWLIREFSLRPGKTESVLVGKDGGLKKRLGRLDFPAFFEAIDRMPMRRAEMRAAGENPPDETRTD